MNTREEEIFKEILLYDEYKKREGFSASQLGQPAMKLKLSKQYPELKVLDLDKQLASRIGTGFHSYAERALSHRDDLLLEHTRSEVFEGETISGTSDVEDVVANVIYDHKTMQHWKANWLWDVNNENHKDAIQEFVTQMSTLAWLKYKETGIYPKATKLMVWVVDYRKPYVRKDGTSKPQAPQYFIVDIPFMDELQYCTWLSSKLAEVHSKLDTQCNGCPDSWVYSYCAYKDVCPVLTKSF